MGGVAATLLDFAGAVYFGNVTKLTTRPGRNGQIQITPSAKAAAAHMEQASMTQALLISSRSRNGGRPLILVALDCFRKQMSQGLKRGTIPYNSSPQNHKRRLRKPGIWP